MSEENVQQEIPAVVEAPVVEKKKIKMPGWCAIVMKAQATEPVIITADNKSLLRASLKEQEVDKVLWIFKGKPQAFKEAKRIDF